MCLRFSNRPVLRCKSRSWFRQLDGRVSPGCLYGSDPIHPLVMNRAADDYRRDLKFVAGIFRTAVLDRYAPLTAGRGDFPAVLGPPAIYVLAMHKDPNMRVSRKAGRPRDKPVI